MKKPTNAKPRRIKEAHDLHTRLGRLDRRVLRVAAGDETPPMNEMEPEMPSIPEELIAKWQRIVNLMAKTIGVPAGLIMKVEPPYIEVLVSSKSEDNPYEKGERADLNTGLYCETVMKQRGPLLVPNALKDSDWDHNPDIELGMISYLGFPLQWPDGKIFGTICVLDREENAYSALHQELLAEFSEMINIDLERLTYLAERERLTLELAKSRDHLEVTVKQRTKELADTCVGLKESEEQVRLLLDSTAEAICGLDLDGNCTFCNPACLQMLGYESSDQLLGKNMHELMHHTRPDNTPCPIEECKIFDSFQRGEGVYVNNEVLWRADRTSFPAEYWSHPIRSEGEVVGAVVTFLDITERKQAEEALRMSESELKTIYDNAPLVMMLVDHERRIVKANAWTQSIAQRSKKEMIGLCIGQALQCIHASDCSPEDCGDEWACEECGVRDTLIHTIRSGKATEAIHCLKVSNSHHHSDSSRNMHILLSTTPLSVSGKDLVLVCIEDITNRIQDEAKLLTAERLQKNQKKPS